MNTSISNTEKKIFALASRDIDYEAAVILKEIDKTYKHDKLKWIDTVSRLNNSVCKNWKKEHRSPQKRGKCA